jgi:hypothetical protein
MWYFQTYISNIYKVATGVTFLVIYLLGLGLSTYSSIPTSSTLFHQSNKTYCTIDKCGCDHHGPNCSCDHGKTSSKSGELVYKKCANHSTDQYTGQSISYFLTEVPLLVQVHLLPKDIVTISLKIESQIWGDSHFQPPQFIA